MIDANLEVVKRWSEAVAAGDLAEHLWAPDLVIVNAEGWALEATYHGRDGLRRWWNDLAEAFSDLAFEVDEIIPVDDERVLTVQRLVGHFRTTGIPFDAPWASVLVVRGGQIASVVGYLSKHRALQAIEA